MFIPKNVGPLGPHLPLYPHQKPPPVFDSPPVDHHARNDVPGGGAALGHLPLRPAQAMEMVDSGVFSAIRELLPTSLGIKKTGWSMPPPLTLEEFISPRPSMASMQYSRAVEQRLKSQQLNHLSGHMTDSNLLGKGSSKDCYRINDKQVLLVQERSGVPLASELMSLETLKAAGFPVVKVFEAGNIPSRYQNGNGRQSSQSAMSQEKLGAFVNFERFTPKSGHDLLDSPELNQNTLQSLQTIRNLIQKNGVCVGDLQGGMRSDGTFVLADVTHLSPLSDANPMQKTALKNLDRTIRAVSTKLNGAPPVRS